MKPTIGEALNPAWWLFRALDRLRVVLFSPTRAFPAPRVTSLTFDLPSASLCGIPFESPVSALAPLGKANWFARSGADYSLFYYPLGAVLSTLQGGFDGFNAYFRPDEGMYGRAHAFQAASLDMRIAAGRRLVLSGETTETRLIEALGRPTLRETVAGLSRCEFDVDGVTINSYCHPVSLLLNELAVYAPDSMNERIVS